MGTRRRSRECALQILFGLDWTSDRPETAIELFWERFAGERPAAYQDVRKGCSELVHGVVDHRDEIDRLLQDCSHNWKLDRMSVVDRNILRVGTFELLRRGRQVPRKVVLNEAIEIAKKFGSEDSGAFVNGLLHQVAQSCKTEPAGANGGSQRPRKQRARAQPDTDGEDGQ